ncbi:hypothetical protein BGX28_000978, partial [Mortierella sp. GBA30]
MVNSDTEHILAPVIIRDTTSIPTSLSEEIKTVPSQDHDSAVLFACNQGNEADEEKYKTLCIVNALELRPFGLRDKFGIERYALAHATVVHKLTLGEVAVCSTNLPIKKRKLGNKHCSACSVNAVPGLEQLFSVTPYASTLLSRTFVELDKAMCELLNDDWRLKPQLQYACAQMLAGAIMFNTKNGQAIIINTLEVYGRKQSIDAHCETFSVRKGVAIKSSLPPNTDFRYDGVWPLTMPGSDGDQLVLGTQSFNALVTSSLRLDSNIPASVG